ncbi:hypothetical protein ACN28S_00300 [Cystobacter fuscus]
MRGATSVLLAEDALSVSAVTEQSDGLVDGYGNRVYLRATTAAGRLLPGAELTVRRAWDPNDEGVRAVTDEDGVAAFQLDPGPPINVVLPALPVRPAPRPPPVRLDGLKDLLADEGDASLEDQLAVERWLEPLRPCARFVSPDAGSFEVEFGLRVTAGGAVVDVTAEDSPLASCAAAILRARSLPPGRERMLGLTLSLTEPGLPSLGFEVLDLSGASEGLEEALHRAALDARECLPADLSLTAPLPAVLTGARVRASARWKWAGRPHAPRRTRCPPRTGLHPVSLHGDAAERGARPRHGHRALHRRARLPLLRGRHAPGDDDAGLRAEGEREGRDGGARLDDVDRLARAAASHAPARLARARPGRRGREHRAAARPGLRGGTARGARAPGGRQDAPGEGGADRDGAGGALLPAHELRGLGRASWNGAVARVYVAPQARLALEVAPDKATYAPGELAHLQVNTWVDGRKGPAAVGLFGVDESLSQLVALPDADALDGMRPAPSVPSPAFGVLDSTALVMGRIRGANAAAATLLRVKGVPARAEGERLLSFSARSPFEPDVELTEPFYRVLSELTVRVRSWEESAPEGETLSPEGLARQWEQALTACEQRGEKVTDAYGRRLRLSRLPPELLALTDPRAVVVNGTRLPQDIENWGAWVARESP